MLLRPTKNKEKRNKNEQGAKVMITFKSKSNKHELGKQETSRRWRQKALRKSTEETSGVKKKTRKYTLKTKKSPLKGKDKLAKFQYEKARVSEGGIQQDNNKIAGTSGPPEDFLPADNGKGNKPGKQGTKMKDSWMRSRDRREGTSRTRKSGKL